MDRYALDNDAVQASGRFDALEHCYDPMTRQCLSDLGVDEGWRCLEVGAGGGSVASWMADRVAPTGSVVATDVKPPAETPDRVRTNLIVVRHDITADDLPEAEFDLAHARLVLLHLPDRIDALSRIIASLKPGGWLLLEEFDCAWTPVLRAPDDDAARLFDQVHAAFLRRLEAAGADPLWGRKVFAAMAEAGLTDLASQTYAQTWTGGGPGIALHRLNTEQLAPDLIAGGVSEDDLTRFWALLDDPGFAVNSYPLISAWGRHPGTER